jgi:hypothetical protein
MKCPICKNDLHKNVFATAFIKDGAYHFCPIPDCPSFGLLWDDDGYIYHDDGNTAKEFIDDNQYAFGSYARREKAKLNYPRKSRTIFALYPFKWIVKTEYDINLDGEIEKSNHTLKTMIKKNGYYQLWGSPFKLFRRCIADFKKNKAIYMSGDESVYELLVDSLNPPKWDKRWGRKWASWWLTLLNSDIKKKTDT